MSSDSDKVVFDEALAPADNTALFQSKRWTYITDNSSNGGKFNGQLQFNLNTLANLNQWSDLSQAVIQFPVRLRINCPAGGTLGSVPSTFAATIKNGFHQFVDSVQITIGGTTVQSAQIFENVNTSFKMLSEWSLEEYRKWGPSLGISLDDYQLALDGAATTYAGLDNTALSSTVINPGGFYLTAAANSGYKERAHHINNSTTSTTTARSILVNATALGKGNVSVSTTTVAANADAFTLMTLATIRLKDISDICSKLPPTKQLRGFVYVNYNAGSYAYTVSSAGALSAITPAALFGRTMPAMLGAIPTPSASTLAFTFTAEVSGEIPSGSSVGVPHNNARLYVPYYVANPDIDRALSHKKTIRYNERFVSSFTIDAGQSFTGTLSPGIVNPKRVILLPQLIGDSNNPVGLQGFAAAPELSALSHEPAGSSPFAALNNLQFIVGGVPMFQTPLQMDWETFQNEITQQGIDGGLNTQQTSGLLNQRLWNQMYRFYTCDIGRRMVAEDGASKSVIVQCQNYTNSKMRVIAWILYEREVEIDTVMGSITQGL